MTTIQEFLLQREQAWKTWYANIPIEDKYKTARPEIIMERMAMDEDWDALSILFHHCKDYRTTWFQLTLLEHYSNMSDSLPMIPDSIRRQINEH